jgi:hypothetical protein
MIAIPGINILPGYFLAAFSPQKVISVACAAPVVGSRSLVDQLFVTLYLTNRTVGPGSTSYSTKEMIFEGMDAECSNCHPFAINSSVVAGNVLAPVVSAIPHNSGVIAKFIIIFPGPITIKKELFRIGIIGGSRII